ncbi:hypothetical protein RBJ75_15935 [Rhodopseudomonas sp. BAL398]|uniref:hypothetical protein n=1 Tax=Rhodopseudomonas sp. BAL398 TaxID=3034676 RepID=UPI000B063A03|nr:hypothetical protein [Rhodopseudomonas sp. BAL398]MDF3810831.1 hypothetical protein [Rhodopseudomonas sp. BAL398]WOK15668.1 hypothetical protein RBJ75_15935 [Rhodopseudomonas sp. BAL398]
MVMAVMDFELLHGHPQPTCGFPRINPACINEVAAVWCREWQTKIVTKARIFPD